MSSTNTTRWRDYNTISDEWHNNRMKLKCCKDMVKAVNTGLIDWFNEFHGERYCSLKFPERGYYIFNNDNKETVIQINFCPFCSKNLSSL